MVVVLSQRQEDGAQETELISAIPSPAFKEYTKTFVAAGGAGLLSIRRPAAQGEIALDRISIQPWRAFTVTGLGVPAWDMPVTPPVVTDHLTWAKPLSGGPITALFSMHYKYDGARDFVELAQRVDLDYDILMGGKAAEDPVRVNRRLGNDEYDVFVVSCTRRLPDALRDLILDRVEAGHGLVLVENTSCWSSHFIPDQALTTVGPDHYLRRDLALDVLPDILARVDAGRWGRGRVAVLRFDREKSYFHNIWPAERGEPAYRRRECRFWEGWHALIARSLAWAARRETEHRITCTLIGRTVSAKLATAEPGTRLRVRARSGRELRFDGALLPAVSRRYGAEVRRYGLFGVYIAGEAMLCAGAGKTGIHEVCFSPFCETRYQRWLSEQYGEIGELNAEWDTGYTDFRECRGMLTGVARERANPAPFVDFREFMADVWREGLRTATDAYREVDPGLRVGYSHCFGPVTLGATDFHRIATGSGLGWGQEYPECRKSQARYAGFRIWRSFYPSDWPDLAWTGYDHSRAALEYEPWWLALHGSRGLSYFSVNSVTQGRSYACVFPTLANTQASLWMRDALKDLVGGVGKLLMEFDREPARIGILWSFPSLSVAWCESDLDYWQASEGPNDRAYGSWYKSAYYFRLLCEEVQLDYRHVAAQQILEQGVLEELDMLFLPAAIAVSPALIDALRRYVEGGGTVLGDWRCCRTDGHGKPYPLNAQPVEHLFGVRRTRPDASYGPRTITFTGDHPRLRLLDASMPGTCAEALEVVPGAKALAAHPDGTPAVVVREAGRGRTVYLNLVLPKYDVVARDLIRQTAAWAGVPRPVVVEGKDAAAPPRAYCVARFTRGGNRVVGVVRDHRLCRDEEPVRIALDADAHLYDIRERRYLGLNRAVETRIKPAQTRVYALLPYRVTGMTLDVSRSIVVGTDLRTTAGIATEGAGPGPHVFRIEVADPHGELVYPYCRNVLAESGRCTVAVPIALNDLPGTWTVSIRDVLTDVSRAAEFEVAPAAQAEPPAK